MRILGYILILAAIVFIVVFAGAKLEWLVDLASFMIVVFPAIGIGLYLGGMKGTLLVCKLLFLSPPETGNDYHLAKIIAKTMGKVTIITGFIALLIAWITILATIGLKDEKFPHYLAASLVPLLYALILNLLIFIPVGRRIKVLKIR